MPDSMTRQSVRVVLVLAKALIWAVVIMWIADIPVRPAY